MQAARQMGADIVEIDIAPDEGRADRHIPRLEGSIAAPTARARSATRPWPN
jgi:hypothetical protein